MGRLQDQVAVVTGAGTGIGAATALRFVEEGATVIIVGRRREKLEATARQSPSPEKMIIAAGDVREPATVDAVLAEARKLGRLDIVVNNAAMAYPVDFLETDLDEWRKIMDVILIGAYRFSHEASRFMIEKGIAGRIVNVTSIHGTQAEPLASSYGAAKAAVNQFSRCLAVELAPHNIRVNAVAPGFVDTPMSVYGGENELDSPRFKQQYVAERRIPLARAGDPPEIAAAILFLASEESSYVTGHVLTVDGGLTCTF